MLLCGELSAELSVPKILLFFSSKSFVVLHLNLPFAGGLPWWAQMVKNLPCSAGDPGSIPGLGRPPGEGNDYPLQVSCLGNPMDRGAWRVTVHGVTESQTRLSDLTYTHSFKYL